MKYLKAIWSFVGMCLCRRGDRGLKYEGSHYCEATIDHSQLSYQEKEDQKRQMKQSLEVYIQGVKDEMRGARNPAPLIQN